MSDEKKPLVSVLMTAYNREKYIAEAIESVLSSSYKNFELIIVDDCSVDNTVLIAKSYAEQDNRITVYLNETNLGDYANRNRAASYAQGEYLMHCDSDDKLLVDGIEYCVNAMSQFPEVPFGMYLYNYEKGAVPFVLESDVAIRRHFIEKPFLSIGPGGTILRRDFFNSINGYPEKYGACNDMYFNIKSVCSAPILLLPFDFMFYRRHDDQEINNSYSYLINNYRYLRDALNELPLPLTQEQKRWIKVKNNRRFVTNIVKYYRTTRSFSKSRKALKDARFSVLDFLQGVFH